MGKGEIISHLGSGKYSVKLALHREHITAKISDLAAQIIVLDNSIAALDPAAEGYEASLEKLTALKLSCEKKKAYLENPSHVPDDPTLDAWCADLTEDLSGEVGTIEVPGERGTVLIQPGEGGNAVYDANRDGQLQPAVGSRSAPATFYNLAMLPGWQKFKPTYRYGTISNIDTVLDTCDVALEAAISSQQDLGVNQGTTLTGISVDYMSCNASAFTEGDEVLVEFVGQVWSGAKVVGFKDNPKGCGWSLKLTRGDGTLITEASGLLGHIYLCNSDGDRLSITTPVYNVASEEWDFDLKYAEDEDVNGYWLSYTCDDNLTETQYPYKYKSVDKEQNEDLIYRGSYEDVIPYSKVVTTYSGFIDGDYNLYGEKIPRTENVWDSTVRKYTLAPGGMISKKYSVTSSVPFSITATIYPYNPSTDVSYFLDVNYVNNTTGHDWLPSYDTGESWHNSPWHNLTGVAPSGWPYYRNLLYMRKFIVGGDYEATMFYGEIVPEEFESEEWFNGGASYQSILPITVERTIEITEATVNTPVHVGYYHNYLWTYMDYTPLLLGCYFDNNSWRFKNGY